ncbi:MAG: hypothetical protein ABI579_00565 [Candidatus Sumerlaeota bacterium]
MKPKAEHAVEYRPSVREITKDLTNNLWHILVKKIPATFLLMIGCFFVLSGCAHIEPQPQFTLLEKLRDLHVSDPYEKYEAILGSPNLICYGHAHKTLVASWITEREEDFSIMLKEDESIELYTYTNLGKIRWNNSPFIVRGPIPRQQKVEIKGPDVNQCRAILGDAHYNLCSGVDCSNWVFDDGTVFCPADGSEPDGNSQSDHVSMFEIIAPFFRP